MDDAEDDAIFVGIVQRLSNRDLQSLSEGIHAIQHRFKRHRSLDDQQNMSPQSSYLHSLTELYVMEYLKDHLIGIREYQTSVTDFVYRDIKFAFRVISGKSGLLLQKQNTSLASPSCKQAWKYPILLLNCKSEPWFEGTNEERKRNGLIELCLERNKASGGLD